MGVLTCISLFRGNLGRRMAEDSTPIQDSDRSVFFYCLRIVLNFPRIVFNFPRMVFLLSENCFTIFVIVLSRFALNDAGRSMVAALVARILEDPQLGDEQIRLSWTTTVGEVRVDYSDSPTDLKVTA